VISYHLCYRHALKRTLFYGYESYRSSPIRTCTIGSHLSGPWIIVRRIAWMRRLIVGTVDLRASWRCANSRWLLWFRTRSRNEYRSLVSLAVLVSASFALRCWCWAGWSGVHSLRGDTEHPKHVGCLMGKAGVSRELSKPHSGSANLFHLLTTRSMQALRRTGVCRR
jgi:hypothetical protein